MKTDEANQVAEATKTVEVNLKTLLETGAHFGGKTSLWNPKMAPYLYGARNGIYIIDLDTTLKLWEAARKVIYQNAVQGGELLFVSTKHQSKDTLAYQARLSGSPYVQHKWNAGNLTNFSVMRNSIRKLERYEDILAKSESGEMAVYNKKELLNFTKEVEKLNRTFGGLRDMRGLPSMIFVTDVGKEEIACSEARILDIPIVALIDSDSNPTGIDYPIPANDDAKRSMNLFIQAISQTIREGKDERAVNKMLNQKTEAAKDGIIVDTKSKKNLKEKDNIEVVIKKQ